MDEAAKQAQREYARQYRQENKAKIAAKKKAWTDANRDHVRNYKKQWAQDNPEKTRQYTETYWQKKAAQAGPVCLHCKQPFEPKRSDAKFCSTRCRVSHNRNK